MAAKRYPKPHKWYPKNPHKYVGDVDNIIARSSWERKWMIWADNNPAVERWASEEIILDYISPVDNRPHRYFTDFAAVIRNRDGVLNRYLIEIKPKIQTLPPKRGKRSQDKYIADLATYAVNQAKWAVAEQYCKKNNMTFMVITEDHLL